MTKVRNAIFAGMLVAAAACAATDAGLLSLVMPDARFISGIHVQNAKTSKFGMYVLSQMQGDDPSFQKFIAETQFDPRNDLSEIVVATAGASDNPTFLVVGRGRFNPSAIATTALSQGATKITVGGIDIITHPTDKSKVGALAFLPDGSTALMGTLSAVEDALQRITKPTVLPSDVAGKISTLSAKNDAWFLSTGPVTDFFAGKIADPNLGGAMAGNLMQAIQQASGGIKFDSDQVTISGEALTRSPKDAEALRDVVKFVAGLVQLNKDSNTEAQKVASLVDNLQVSATGSTMLLTLPIPEDLMEKLFMPQANRPARAAGHRRAFVRGPRPAPAAIQ